MKASISARSPTIVVVIAFSRPFFARYIKTHRSFAATASVASPRLNRGALAADNRPQTTPHDVRARVVAAPRHRANDAQRAERDRTPRTASLDVRTTQTSSNQRSTRTDVMTPSSNDGRASDETREAPSSNAKKMWRKVATPVRSATKIASALVGGFFWQGEDEGDGFEGGAKENRTMDVGRAMDEEQSVRTRGNGAGGARAGTTTTTGRIGEVGGATRTTRFANEAAAAETASDSPTPFTEIREFLRRGQMDRERMARSSAGGAYGEISAAVKPPSPFERAPAFDAHATPARERPMVAQMATPGTTGVGASSPGYASVRRSYGASGTPSLLGTRGRTAIKPTILEPPMEQTPTPPRASLKRDRELTIMDLERERARVTTPRRLESAAHSPGPGALARESASPAYHTPSAKPVTSAVTTDTAKRILQTLDRLAGARTATPMGVAAARPSLFATRPTQPVQAPSPVGAAFDKQVTPTSATFVATPKSGVSFATSPMPFISASSSGRAPTTPYPTSAEPEIETPNFKFGEDSTLLATGKKPKAPSGPVASVPIKFTFGEGQTTPLFTKKSVAAAPVKTTTTVPPPPAQPTAVTQKSEEAPAASKPVMNLWSADFLAKNQEHQKKVQAAIEEEEKAASKPPAPSPFAPSAPAGDKPAFSFGIHAASSAPAPSTDASGFTFGSTAPAAPTSAPASAPAFSFGSTAPVKPAETTEVKKPAGESGLLAFLGASSSEAKTASEPATAPTFTFGAPPKSPDNVPVKVPDPAPAFSFGGETKAPESSKPASAPFTFGTATPAAAAAPALFTFGAKPVEKAAEPEKEKSQLSASAPAFSFAAGSKKEDEPKAAETAKPFTFGAAPALDATKPAGDALFSFGGASAEKKEEQPKPASGGFSFGATAAPAFGAASSAVKEDAKPVSAPFVFGGASTTPASSGGFTFGASAPPAAPASGGGFTFGAASSTTAASTPFGGGLSVNTGKPAASVFGQPPKPDEQPNTPEPMSPFESSKSPLGAASTGSSLFGGASTNSFAAPPASSAPSTNPFGGGGANPFAGASAGVTNPFGGASSTPAFGGAAAPFGGASASANPFGGVAAPAPAVPAPNPFGANPAPAGGFSLGAGDESSQGGRKPPRKFKRPPRR